VVRLIPTHHAKHCWLRLFEFILLALHFFLCGCRNFFWICSELQLFFGNFDPTWDPISLPIRFLCPLWANWKNFVAIHLHFIFLHLLFP
jgi:hypothetical protein